MAKEDPRLCTTCGTHNTTVKHILTELLKYENLIDENYLPEQLFKTLGPVGKANIEIKKFFKIY